MRTGGERKFVFLLNFTGRKQPIDFGNKKWHDLITDRTQGKTAVLEQYGVMILEQKQETT